MYISFCLFSSPFGRFDVQIVGKAQHGITGDDVAPRLVASLSVQCLGDVGKLPEDVETVEGERHAVFEKFLRQGGVPYDVIRVHAAFAVAPAAVQGQVGVELQVPWQFGLCYQAVIVVVGVEGREVFPAAGQVVPRAAGFHAHFHVLGEGIFHVEASARVVSLHGAAARCHAVRHADEVHRVVEPRPKCAVQREAAGFVERHGVVHVAADVVVPVHVLGAVGAHARCLVVHVSLCHGILRDGVAPVGVEVALLAVAVQVVVHGNVVLVRVFQSRVAQADVQRVIRGTDVDERGHGREGDAFVVADVDAPLEVVPPAVDPETRLEHNMAAADGGIQPFALVVQRLPYVHERQTGFHVPPGAFARCPGLAFPFGIEASPVGVIGQVRPVAVEGIQRLLQEFHLGGQHA